MAQEALTNDIIFVLCPPWGVHEPHLGLSYLCTYVRSHAYDPVVLDLNIRLYNRAGSAAVKALWSPDRQTDWMNKRLFYEQTCPHFSEAIEGVSDEIIASGRRFVGFTVTAATRLFAIEVARRVKEKEPERIIIFGGIGCFTTAERKMFPPEVVDIFVIGEGEMTLLEILRRDFTVPLHKKMIPGTAVFATDPDDGEIVSLRPLAKDLDTIPFPTFDEFPLDCYYYSRQNLDEFTMMHIPLIASRGCVNRCAFCNDVTLWQSYRFRSARHVCDEILYEATRRNITSFVFQDLTINGNLKQLREMCTILKEEIRGEHQRPVTWVSNCIARKVMTEELLSEMHAAGCHTLIFGIESGSDKVLKAMRKGYTAQTAGEVLRNCKRVGISTWINLIIGFPGEGEQEFNETKAWLQEYRDAIDKIQNFNVCSIVYNSDLEHNAFDYGAILAEGEMGYFYWTSCDGTNTFEVRKRRLLELRTFIEGLGICIESSNIAAEEGKFE